AFNLAKLTGVPRRGQLAPLMLWWMIAGGALLSLVAGLQPEERRWIPRARFAGLLAFVSLVTVLPIAHHAASGAGQTGSGLRGKYYRNLNWRGEPVEERVDRTIDFDWSQKMPLQPPFSVEWTGELVVEQTGDYTFTMSVDDGALLEIDGEPVLDLLHGPILSNRDGTITLTAGRHALRIRYFNELFGGSIHLWWRSAGRLQAIVPDDALVPAAANAQQ
ncbi:MAG: PA14 domain-containing protein, partial [Verrucomicrobiota bacterium]|nr:PA14 domain-containing protein [Verrucomicrobiota bacterium]